MGGRDHSCERCGCGGFNDPDGECECSPHIEFDKRGGGGGGMRVWVLTQSYPYEGERLFGVYATREQVEQAQENYQPGLLLPGAEWCVYEVEIGAAPRWRQLEDRQSWKDLFGEEDEA